MNKKMFVLLALMACSGLAAACTAGKVNPTPNVSMPNPASVYCEENGGQLELREDASGGVSGICHFSDGSECDEWAFFRAECKSGDSLISQPSAAPDSFEPVPSPTDEFASDGWKVYRNHELGYSFHYPADAVIGVNDEPLKSLSINGVDPDGESWLSMAISHPRDREEYLPPEGTDLLQWLIDHYLLGEKQLPDVQIAGTIAVHFRHERSPQSPAFDTYFFARNGQLYRILIGHPLEKEDWALNDHFLANFRFEP